MKQIQVHFFAAFREQAGTESHGVRTAARTAQELFDEMRAAFPGLARYENMKFAINDEMVPAGQPLRDGDRVLFFPPVAGG